MGILGQPQNKGRLTFFELFWAHFAVLNELAQIYDVVSGFFQINLDGFEEYNKANSQKIIKIFLKNFFETILIYFVRLPYRIFSIEL